MNLYDPAKSLLDSLDPMKQMNEDMKRLLDPMYDINKALQPMHSFSESIASMLNPLQSFNERMEAMLNPMSAWEKSLQHLYDPMKKWNDQMESMLNPYKGFDKYFDAFKPASTYWNDIYNSSSAIQNAISAVSRASLQNYDELFSSSMSSYKTLAAAISAKNFEHFLPKNLDSIVASVIANEAEYRRILDSYTATENDETALQEELQAIKDEILEAVNSKTARIEEQLSVIQARITALNNPLLLVLFSYIILPLLLNAFYDYAIKPMLNMMDSPKQQQIIIKKEVIRTTKSFFEDPQLRTNYRIVTASVLNVRKSKSKSSKTIAYTSFGEVVEIVRKERNWCLIRRYDRESETSIQGWVLTRYLGRIR